MYHGLKLLSYENFLPCFINRRCFKLQKITFMKKMLTLLKLSVKIRKLIGVPTLSKNMEYKNLLSCDWYLFKKDIKPVQCWTAGS